MKVTRLIRLGALLAALIPASLLAQNGVWTSTTSGNWSDTTKWNGGTVATGAGSVADFSTLDITTTVNVTNDVSRSIGIMLFADRTPNNNWTLNSSGTAVLTLDNTGGSGAPTINVSNQTLTVGLALSGSAGMTKTGAGTLQLSSTNNYTGTTTISGGVVNIGASGAQPASQVIYNGVTAGALVLSAQLFQPAGSANQTFYQLFGGTTFAAGVSKISQAGRASSSHPAIILGAITRNVGATVDFGPQTGSAGTTADATTGIGTTTANGGSGILGGYATHNGLAEWAVKNGNNLTQGGQHVYGGATYTPNTATALGTATQNADLSGGVDTTLSASSYIGSVRFTNATARTITLNSGVILTNVSGGFLETTLVGANNNTIAGPGSITSSNGLDIIFIQNNTSGSLTVGAALIDNGATALGLTKSGAGTLILSGANTYSGNTFLNAGTLQVGAGGTSGTLGSSPALTNGGTLIFNRTDTALVYSGVISGAGVINQTGSGTTTLAGDSTCSGTTTISAGTLQLGNGGAGGSLSNSVIVDNGALVFNFNSSKTRSLNISGSGSLALQGGGTLLLTTNFTYAGATAISGNSKLALAASATVSNSPSITIGAGSVLDVSSGGSLTLNTVVGQTLLGSGTVKGSLVVPGDNVSVWGVLQPGGVSTAGTLTITNNLAFQGGEYVADVSTTGTDLISVSNNVDLTLGSIAVHITGTLTNGIYKLIQFGGSVTAGSVANLTLKNFSVPGKVGQLVSSTANEVDLQVSTPVSQNLLWTGDGSVNSWDTTGSVDWLVGGSPTSFNDFDIVTFDDSSTNPVVNINSAVQPLNITINSTNNNYTFAGTGIAGGALTKNGPGTLTNLTVNTTSGSIVINGGALQVGNGATDGDLGSGAISNNAALVFQQTTSRSALGNISGAGTLTQNGSATLTLLGNNTYSGQTTINAGTLQVGAGGFSGTLGTGPVVMNNTTTLNLNSASALSVSNGISGNGALTVSGPGTIAFGGVNSYQNNTTIASGTLKLGAANAIPYGGLTTGWLVLDGGASSAGTLDLNGFNQAVNELSGTTGTVLGQILNNGGSGVNTLTIGTPSTTTYAGLIKDNNNAGSGKVGLTITGNGTLATSLTLSGANNYTGPVYIDGASVIMGGSLTTVGQSSIGSGAITLTNNGTLAMNGLGNVSTSTGFGNSILVPAGTTGNLKTGGRTTYSGSVTVHGTLNLTTSYVRSSPTGDWSASDGQINIIAGSGGGDVYLATTGGFNFGTAAIDLGAGTHLYNSANNGGPINMTIGELTGTGTISDTTAAGPFSRTTIYVVGGRNTDATFSGTIRDQARVTGINKVGTGKWTLSGVDSYSASTIVSSGALIIGTATSFMSNSPSITVNSGALLDVSIYGGLTLAGGQTWNGNGVITGAVTMVTGDILSPGVGTLPGTLSFSNTLTLTGDFVTNNFNLSSDPTGVSLTNSQVFVQGDLNISGSNIVTINPLNTILGAGTYTLFKYTGTLMTNGVAAGSGTLENSFVAGGAFADNAHVTLTFSNTANNQIVMIAVPSGQNIVWSGGVFGTATNNWDLNLSTNWVNSGTVTNFHHYDSVTFDDSATNLNAIVAGALAPAAIAVGSTNAYTFSGSGKLTGPTGITKTGTNVLTISNTGGNDYTGTVSIGGGTLKTGTGTALGAVNSTVVANGGTLDLNGQSFTNRTATINVQGSGYNGQGAIVNSGAQLVNNGLSKVTLTGDATFGATIRWDIINGTLTGNNFNLTKVGANNIVLTRLADIGVSNINVQAGQITLIGDTTLGLNSGNLTLWPGTTLDLYSTTVTNTKPVSLTNAIISSSNLTNVYGGTVNLNGTGTLTANTPFQLNGALNGSGGVLKLGASTLTLAGSSSYTGNTTISNAVLALVGTASIATSPILDLAVAGAQLDVTGLSGSFSLGSGQTLKGVGSVKGSVTVPAGSTIAPGESAIGTLTVSNNVTLAGTNVMIVNTNVSPNASKLVAGGTLSYGGTLVINNVGPALAAGNQFTLFSTGGIGSFTISPTHPDGNPALAWDVTQLASGILKVVAGVPTSPDYLTNNFSGSTLALSWPAGKGWRLQMQTNSLTIGYSTNWVYVSDTSASSTNITPGTDTPSVFYRLAP